MIGFVFCYNWNNTLNFQLCVFQLCSLHKKCLSLSKKQPSRFYSSIYIVDTLTSDCVKRVRIRSYSGTHFPTFGLNMEQSISPYSVRMRENADQNYSEYGHFSCSFCTIKPFPNSSFFIAASNALLGAFLKYLKVGVVRSMMLKNLYQSPCFFVQTTWILSLRSTECVSVPFFKNRRRRPREIKQTLFNIYRRSHLIFTIGISPYSWKYLWTFDWHSKILCCFRYFLLSALFN